ncbi:SRPBCC domain-containing protein [uncultured Imperialibacter sp.]|uniref:SRPBCC family protein n=1 Tax=uncultured Imperialibacter sp. TaxID=1672639 RepID=UPI0030D901F2|tara:strand:+ start:44005 stop:44454 length:450 start_codon:yes stop_codon:yes gene_type:complete
MPKEMTIKNTVTIAAPASKVWDALVNPEHTKKYMFGCEPITNWQPGSSIKWIGVFDGKEIEAVTGKVVSIDKGKSLAYTTFDPNGTYSDLPENHLVVTYSLVEKGGSTEFTVTQGDYSTVAEGQKRYDDTMNEGGWAGILEQIKGIVEA